MTGTWRARNREKRRLQAVVIDAVLLGFGKNNRIRVPAVNAAQIDSRKRPPATGR